MRCFASAGTAAEVLNKRGQLMGSFSMELFSPRLFSPRLFSLVALLFSTVCFADDVRIVDVSVECSASCTFLVTLEHDDQGWDHYADLWEVVTLDGRVLGSRVLYHPHENEQPFTRSLSAVIIPQGMNQVKIRARDSVHGYGKQELLVDIPG
jgi:hypothetical protein